MHAVPEGNAWHNMTLTSPQNTGVNPASTQFFNCNDCNKGGTKDVLCDVAYCGADYCVIQ